jgi:hypothetical protein
MVLLLLPLQRRIMASAYADARPCSPAAFPLDLGPFHQRERAAFLYADGYETRALYSNLSERLTVTLGTGGRGSHVATCYFAAGLSPDWRSVRALTLGRIVAPFEILHFVDGTVAHYIGATRCWGYKCEVDRASLRPLLAFRTGAQPISIAFDLQVPAQTDVGQLPRFAERLNTFASALQLNTVIAACGAAPASHDVSTKRFKQQ